ncbi:MAG: NirD/YgiW/YdeI family stress tolerance protein [Alphaproteobacteria bacterium]|nr:NirD/YgiW/YdeI family stress tolerance protein [Alphaproteobacteria bacterium]
MKNKILSAMAALAVMCGAFTVNAASSASDNSNKPISQVSDVQNMADDSTVYIQGYLTQNLGNEMYTFQDNSGTMTVEIDDDLMNSSMYSPTTLVWIAAEVDKQGDVVALEAEEIQFMPNQASNSATSNN